MVRPAFGAGVALVLDESAFLLSLEDVYWSEEGILSLQITFAAIAVLATLALALRVLRRGESVVLGGEVAPSSTTSLPARGDEDAASPS